ncbi:hypothetical protein KCU78_g1558, partial [Aureobasidium melanogenum]
MSGLVTSKPTTGKVGMWNGTNDGQDTSLDHATGGTNMKFPKQIDIEVRDLRSLNLPTTIIANGYQMVVSPTAITTEQFLAASDDSGKELIEQNYYPEVLRFGFRPGQQNLPVQDSAAAKSKISSLAVAHVGREPRNAPARLARVVGIKEAERLLTRYKRWASVNV